MTEQERRTNGRDRRKKINWWYRYFQFNIAIVVLGILYLIYLTVQPYEIPVNHDNPVKVLSKQVKAGEPITLAIDVCYPHDEKLYIYRKLHRIDYEGEEASIQRITNLPDLAVNIKKGCYKAKTNSNIIPFFTLPGNYYMEFTTEIEVNKLKTIRFSYPTETFEVIK